MSHKVALLVSDEADNAALSPFFSLAPWLMLVRSHGERPVIQRIDDHDSEGLISFIAGLAPALMICGHIPSDAAKRFTDAGIDVRVGPCSVPAISLVTRAHVLPHPRATTTPSD
ncbi:MAG: hypothetical protein QF629_02795 [Alphaproteobacteria bacterium]|jgi:predicted Fe-Mo cluster-binding NifX family protein|nr:hypothetical protein [Alphaproteobacteria bacterium]MDP6237980.1 hypothetical protein [Alphaproteobacteria bacterium]MDP7172254.1 hypothetical protein [Alphaproteobacteria bacterium]MDP7233159.1 hypothetical protein [Alphaproteobacteria bacterium]MDP7486692.1 hypothetical protein [Alphaproteobacteria bacterium]|tara:strand:- start:7208 stop:7549 length:342 start_codon:yes stop_codon:yes gene_type:complete